MVIPSTPGPLVGLDPSIGLIPVVELAHLLHQSFGQGSCWVQRRGCLLLLKRPRSGAAFAGIAVAQTLLPLRKEKPLVRPALLPLRTHRVVSDCSLARKIQPFLRSSEAWLDLPA